MARAGALWTHVLSKPLVDVVRLKKTLVARSSQRLFLIDARMRGISTLGLGKLRWLEKITNFPAQLFRLHGQGGRFLWDILPLSAQTHARARPGQGAFLQLLQELVLSSAVRQGEGHAFRCLGLGCPGVIHEAGELEPDRGSQGSRGSQGAARNRQEPSGAARGARCHQKPPAAAGSW